MTTLFKWTGIGELNETIDTDAKHSPWRLVCVDATLDEVDDVRSRLESVIHPSKTYMDFNIGAAFWLASRGEGTLFKEAERGAISTAGRYRFFLYISKFLIQINQRKKLCSREERV